MERWGLREYQCHKQRTLSFLGGTLVRLEQTRHPSKCHHPLLFKGTVAHVWIMTGAPWIGWTTKDHRTKAHLPHRLAKNTMHHTFLGLVTSATSCQRSVRLLPHPLKQGTRLKPLRASFVSMDSIKRTWNISSPVLRTKWLWPTCRKSCSKGAWKKLTKLWLPVTQRPILNLSPSKVWVDHTATVHLLGQGWARKEHHQLFFSRVKWLTMDINADIMKEHRMVLERPLTAHPAAATVEVHFCWILVILVEADNNHRKRIKGAQIVKVLALFTYQDWTLWAPTTNHCRPQKRFPAPCLCQKLTQTWENLQKLFLLKNQKKMDSRH